MASVYIPWKNTQTSSWNILSGDVFGPTWNGIFKHRSRARARSFHYSATASQARWRSPPTAHKPNDNHIRAPAQWTDDERRDSRYLLRALLREATYLPDPHTRHTAQTLIVSSFRSHSDPTTNPERHATHLARGTEWLRTLRAANALDLRALTTVLSHSFARTGKRRHVLLDPLSVPPSPNTPEVEKPLLGPVLRAVIRSQTSSASEGGGSGSAPGAPDTKFPRHAAGQIVRPVAGGTPNIWNKTPAPVRQVKKILKARRTVLEKVEVPLPSAEWEFLRRVCVGEDVLQLPRFRAVTSGRGVASGAAKGERARRDRGADERGLNGVERRRLLRRYQQVFARCPKVEVDGKGEIRVTWGLSATQSANVRRSTVVV